MAEHAGDRKSSRVNVEIAPGVRARLDRYIEQELNSPDQTTVSLTYTDIINQALKEYFLKREPRPKEEHRGEDHS